MPHAKVVPAHKKTLKKLLRQFTKSGANVCKSNDTLITNNTLIIDAFLPLSDKINKRLVVQLSNYAKIVLISAKNHRYAQARTDFSAYVSLSKAGAVLGKFNDYTKCTLSADGARALLGLLLSLGDGRFFIGERTLCRLAHYANLYQKTNDKALGADAILHAKTLLWQAHAQTKQHIDDDIAASKLLLPTHAQIGRVLGLSVCEFDDSIVQIGLPFLLSANVGAGDDQDIERMVDLGGDLHAKSMLVAKSFVDNALMRAQIELEFGARVACEQNGEPIDGDSAGFATAVAILSALANLPVRENLALTGALSQHGQVMAVGAVGEKIESFFRLCSFQTGRVPCVIIPKSCAHDFVPSDELSAKLHADRVRIYLVEHIDEALPLIFDCPLENTAKGTPKRGSLYWHIAKRFKNKETQSQPT